MDAKTKITAMPERESIATNIILTRSASAAIRHARSRQRANHTTGYAIEAIVDLPVAERAFYVMTVAQGVIDATAFGDARDDVLHDLLKLVCNQIEYTQECAARLGEHD